VKKSKPFKVSSRNFKTKSKAIRLRLRSCKSSFISLRRISKSTVLRHHRQMPSTISA